MNHNSTLLGAIFFLAISTAFLLTDKLLEPTPVLTIRTSTIDPNPVRVGQTFAVHYTYFKHKSCDTVSVVRKIQYLSGHIAILYSGKPTANAEKSPSLQELTVHTTAPLRSGEGFYFGEIIHNCDGKIHRTNLPLTPITVEN